MKCGDTFLLYDEYSDGKPHLHVVITDQVNPCVLVSITTRRAKSDTMTCLDVGDHPFISHPSVATFAYSKMLTIEKLTQMVADGDAIPKEPATVQLIARLQNGMRETDRAPREIKQFFKDNLPK